MIQTPSRDPNNQFTSEFVEHHIEILYVPYIVIDFRIPTQKDWTQYMEHTVLCASFTLTKNISVLTHLSSRNYNNSLPRGVFRRGRGSVGVPPSPEFKKKWGKKKEIVETEKNRGEY